MRLNTTSLLYSFQSNQSVLVGPLKNGTIQPTPKSFERFCWQKVRQRVTRTRWRQSIVLTTSSLFLIIFRSTVTNLRNRVFIIYSEEKGRVIDLNQCTRVDSRSTDPFPLGR